MFVNLEIENLFSMFFRRASGDGRVVELPWESLQMFLGVHQLCIYYSSLSLPQQVEMIKKIGVFQMLNKLRTTKIMQTCL